MKITAIDNTKLRNEEHYQFQTDFKGLVEKNTPAALGIAVQFTAYLPLYANEGEALNVIRRSAVTDDLTDADILRDSTFRGVTDAVKAATHHFEASVRAAAARLQVVLDTYGNIAKKPYDEETAAITSLIAELRTGYAADVSTLGISAWIDELDRNNIAFDALKKERYTQDAERTQLKMKETRVAVDQCYHEIVERINALIIVNGAAAYGSFVNELNARIDAYNQMLALRKGKKDAKDDKQVDK